MRLVELEAGTEVGTTLLLAVERDLEEGRRRWSADDNREAS